MQDYVCSAVQIESELVGREFVAGHTVGLESVLEFGNHLLYASSVPLQMLPGIGLVHKRMEHAHLFTGGLVRCNPVSSQCAVILWNFTFPEVP